MVENTELVSVNEKGEENIIRIESSVQPGQDVRPIGCDIQKEDVPFSALLFLNLSSNYFLDRVDKREQIGSCGVGSLGDGWLYKYFGFICSLLRFDSSL